MTQILVFHYDKPDKLINFKKKIHDEAKTNCERKRDGHITLYYIA